MNKSKNTIKLRRSHRVRAKIVSLVNRPRLSIHRSQKYLSVQVIDDSRGITLVAAHSREVAKAKTRLEQAEKLGALIAERALAKKIDKVVFDRGGYKYHGLVKAVAESARQGGLIF